MAIKSPEKLKIHNAGMSELFDLLRRRGVFHRTPDAYEEAGHDRDNDDHGFDFAINGHKIDYKSFGLLLINSTATWYSPYWRNNRNPHRRGLENEFYLFHTGPDPKGWLAMRRSDVYPSTRGHAPYCWKNKLLTLDQLIGACAN